MTDIDSALVHRAEQAVLGALLAGHDAAAVRDLHAAHFTDPVHQALYLAITGHDSDGMAGRLRYQLALLTSARLRRTVAYARELRGRCPEPGHRWVHAAMLLEAARQAGPDAPAAGPQRQAGADQRLAGADEWLAASGAGGRRPGRVSQQNAPLDRRTRQLARTLRPVVQALLRESSGDRAARVGAAGGEPVREGEPDPGAGRRLRREDLQDAVLADLMRRPGDARTLVARVPAEAFSPGARRELYTLLQKAIAAGIPVDPLITAWQASKREPEPAWQPEADGAGRESLTALTLRLGEMATVRGTAAVIARVLLADHECTTAFGPGWTGRPLTWQAGPAAHGQEAGPKPGMAPGPVRPAYAARHRQQSPAAQAGLRRPEQDGGTAPLPRQA
jgi:hypothetical protein